MAIEDTSEVTIQDLKVIIHGLKMTGLGFMEEGAIDEVKSMIKSLPGPEKINQMSMSPDVIKKLQRDIGGIMRLIEIYSNRDKEFKTRYKTRTGLPPRYKVLEWRDAMKQVARNYVRQLIRVSALVDNKKEVKIASDLIKCAKSIKEEKNFEEDVIKIVDDLKKAGFNKEANLIKEAQWMKDLWRGVKEVGKGIGQPVREIFQVGRYTSALTGINQQIEKILQGVMQAAKVAQQQEQKVKLQDISQRMNYMLEIGKDLVDVVVEEAAAPVATPAAAPVATPAATPAAIPFKPGQAVTYRGRSAEVIKMFPEYGTVRLKGVGGRVFAVDLQELINENQGVGAVEQVKRPTVTPTGAPIGVPATSVTTSKKFNLNKFSKSK